MVRERIALSAWTSLPGGIPGRTQAVRVGPPGGSIVQRRGARRNRGLDLRGLSQENRQTGGYMETVKAGREPCSSRARGRGVMRWWRGRCPVWGSEEGHFGRLWCGCIPCDRSTLTWPLGNSWLLPLPSGPPFLCHTETSPSFVFSPSLRFPISAFLHLHHPLGRLRFPLLFSLSL